MISRASWHRRAGAVVLIWLVAAVVVSIFHRNLPSANWLLLHLLLLGAASNAILIWSDHFATSLLRLPDTPVKIRVTRMILLNLGIIGVIVGVVGQVKIAVYIGALLLVVTIVWHVVSMLVRKRKALLSRFFVSVYYYAAAGILFVGVVALGVQLSQGHGSISHEQVILAHAVGALLGWIGLAILGTLITFWPTILHARIEEQAGRAGLKALIFLVLGSVLTPVGFLASWQLLVIAGLALYLVGIAVLAGPFVRAMTARPPSDFATLSVFASVVWMCIGVVALIVIVATSPDWTVVAESSGSLSAAVAVGCVAQVLLGSLSFLLPAMVGGGPAAMRWRREVAGRHGVVRVVAANGALVVCVLPAPSVVRVIASLVVLVALVWAIPLLIRSMLTPPESAQPGTGPVGRTGSGISGPMPISLGTPVDVGVRTARMGGSVVAGLAIVVLAVAIGGAVDPAAIGASSSATSSAAAGVAATGQTTTVEVEIKGMRFAPDQIEVPAGNVLIINLVNNGSDVHDLVLETGQSSGKLKPGERTTFDVGVVGRDLEGWCSVAGHRQMGMVMQIVATGPNANPEQGEVVAAQDNGGHGEHAHGTQATDGDDGGNGDLDSQALQNVMNNPGPDFRARDAVLPPASKAKVHRVKFTVSEVEQEVVSGIRQTRWTFNGSVPGPTLRGKIGDKFIITLVNDGTIGHSIDFHAGALAPDKPMRTIAPGESLTYTFTANRAGVWMYHCSTMPMSVHIANGMFGAVVIDPPKLPKVDREFILVQSETYLGQQGGTADPAKVLSGQPSLVMFNGYPMQYDFQPLRAKVGDRVRFWVLDAGPNRPSSFHVVGGQFDRVWFEGAYLLNGKGPGGAQAMALQPAQGGFVEMTVPEAGNFPFVTHIMADAEKGAHGILRAN